MKFKVPVSKGTAGHIVEQGKEKAVVKERSRSTLYLPESNNLNCSVGVGIGVTIPGPKGSYMMARADVFVSLACTEDGARDAKDRASTLAQVFLEEEAKEIQAYFKSL